MATQKNMSTSEVKAVFLLISHLDTRFQRRPASWPVMWVGIQPSSADTVLAPANESSATDRSSIDRPMNRRLKVKPALKQPWLKLSTPEKTERTSVRSEVHSTLNGRASIHWRQCLIFLDLGRLKSISEGVCICLLFFFLSSPKKSKKI